VETEGTAVVANDQGTTRRYIAPEMLEPVGFDRTEYMRNYMAALRKTNYAKVRGWEVKVRARKRAKDAKRRPTNA
jgi:hypothetical protein